MKDFQISGAQMSIVFFLQHKDKAITLWGSGGKVKVARQQVQSYKLSVFVNVHTND